MGSPASFKALLPHYLSAYAHVSILTISSILRQPPQRDNNNMQDLLHAGLSSTRALHSRAYPILTLPPEITSEIFVRCLPAERQLDMVNPKEAPLLLMQVCSLWREIAMSTPELWADFDLEIGWPEPHLVDFSKAWLQRACDRPLAVNLSSCGLMSDIDNIDRFIAGLWGRSHKIHTLELKIAVEDLDVIDVSICGPNFRTLQRLSVQLQQGLGGGAVDREPIMLFHDTPALCEVRLSEIPPSSISLPWSQITRFCGEIYSVAECLEALSLMPNLRHCTFAAFDSISSPPRPFSTTAVHTNNLNPITHPHIQHLELSDSISDSFLLANSMDVLAFITLPALQTLQIRGVKDYSKTVLDSFLSRSSPALHRLSIHPLESQNGATELCFSPHFTSLPLMDLEVWYPDSHLLLRFLGKNPELLPKLRRLSLLGCRNVDNEASGNLAAPAANHQIQGESARPSYLQLFRVVSESGRTLSDTELALMRLGQLKASCN
ncbi:hypothetical protein R3P38DRAFT_2833473 [Favolaschia claudopus]|uniref:F-box domain-containing protein n=1 Tax=Favolaschia claudopus TaxID=2862362 RepID=A0AAW0EDC5_9AGAR